MVEIILKGKLDHELTRIGLCPEMTVFATPDRVGKTGAMYFERHLKGFKYDCVVWPINYDVVESETDNEIINYVI